MLQSGQQTRLDALTGLRYFAAMSVVLSHVANANADLNGSILSQLSAVGMPLFFSLSGFLMSYNYFTPFAERRPGTLRRFYVARFARIYPGSMAAYLAAFWWGGFPANLGGAGLHRLAASLRVAARPRRVHPR